MPHPTAGYRLPDGSKVVGTTTVLGRFKESGGLLWWACQMGQKYPALPVREALYGERDTAADIGSCVHSMVETHTNGEDASEVFKAFNDKTLDAQAAEKVWSGFNAYLAWERMTRLEITHQELQLVCPVYRFGGTPDAIGLIDGEPCLLDWKTSKSVYPDMLIQLAAYGYLCEHGLQQERDYQPLGIKVRGYHLCKFSKEHGDFSHHYYPDLSEGWEQFKRYLECYETDKILKARAA